MPDRNSASSAAASATEALDASLDAGATAEVRHELLSRGVRSARGRRRQTCSTRRGRHAHDDFVAQQTSEGRCCSVSLIMFMTSPTNRWSWPYN